MQQNEKPNKKGRRVTELSCTPAFETALDGFRVYQNVEGGLSPNTLQAYRRDLLKFGDFLRRQGISDWNVITPMTVQDYLVELSNSGLKESSISRHVVAVRMLLRWLHMTKQLSRDFTCVIELPKRGRPLPKTLNLERTTDLVTAPDLTSELGLRDRAILEMFYGCGLRVSELCNLTENSVDLRVNYVRCMGKGRKERVVPIGVKARDALEAYLEHQRPQLIEKGFSNGVIDGPLTAKLTRGLALFLSNNGRPLERTNVWRLVKRHAGESGIEGHVSPHTLRHSYATHLLEGGANLRIVQELLGHANIVTTEIYTHIATKHLQEMHAKFHPHGEAGLAARKEEKRRS